MKLNDLMNFAKGKEPGKQGINCLVTRKNEKEIEISGCTLNNMETDLIFNCITTKEDIEYFKNKDHKAMLKERIENIRQQLIKIGENVKLDEIDLLM